MADAYMIARLAGLPEFAELKRHVEEREEEDVKTLAMKTYKIPEEHDALEWERLKARYAGMHELLGLPAHARALNDRKESQ